MRANPRTRSIVLAFVTAMLSASLVGASLARAGGARAADPEPPAVRPTSQVAPLGKAASGDVGNPGYHYAVAHTQVLPSEANGLRATLSVHRPDQVRGRLAQHSIGQIAVGHTLDRSYLEAGWRQFADGPRLFVYWRPADGADTCYNLGCGFRPTGPGLRPGAALRPGSEITLAFRHVGRRWWLRVDGLRSGYYPDRLWRGRFTGTDFAQLYGEVFAPRGQRLCADMGNGLLPGRQGAASMRAARWLGGPPLRLHRARTVREVHRYGFFQTSRNSFRYGGPGEC